MNKQQQNGHHLKLLGVCGGEGVDLCVCMCVCVFFWRGAKMHFTGVKDLAVVDIQQIFSYPNLCSA